jgi:DNA-binding transcriptional LysR family regulator
VELRHLHYFVAVAEERSFTRAAERLWIAQPGLSTQIRRLEAELGIDLFTRHTRGVSLTDAGELFLERARVTLAAADAARSTGDDLGAGVVGRIRLGVAAPARWRGAPGLLADFAHDRAEVEVTVVEAYGGTLVRDLRDGRLDAVVAPAVYGSPEFRRLTVGRDPWLLLAGGSHRLAAADGPLAASELQGERVVVTGHRDGAAYDQAVTGALEAFGVACELRRGGAGPGLFAAVAAGEALALTTSCSTAGLVARRLQPVRTVECVLLWRDLTPAPALEQFIRAAAADSPATADEPRFVRPLRPAA